MTTTIIPTEYQTTGLGPVMPTSTVPADVDNENSSDQLDDGASYSTNLGPVPPAPTSTGSLPSGESSTDGANQSEGSNTGATVGIIIGCLVVAGVIGVLIFRKWKLSPSRQFKTNLAGSTTDTESDLAVKAAAAAGAAGAGAAMYGQGHHHEEASEYATSYDNIYRPHDASHPPMEAISGGGASVVAVSAMGGYQYDPSQQYDASQQYDPSQQYPQQQPDYGYGDAYQQQQQQQQQQYPSSHVDGQYYQDPYQYPQQQQLHHPQQQQHEYQAYDQYQQVPSTVPMATVAAGGGMAPTGAPMPTTAGGPPRNVHSYSSEDFHQNDHFLRELRE
ncbi:hypothetical protein BGZ65_006038 [Modicella reniformis]|uniref:Uncharacterized protein n=1 Tax=Modicella reniformis TaxID=1440133 RepID=A0A9P6SSV6_9FUNG|nr:hypothetical protein BGZ65_006038 [Modicella reniformis]